MSDALTSVGAIRAADTITYIDHFGGDSEGPVSMRYFFKGLLPLMRLWHLDFRLRGTQWHALSAAVVSF